MIPAFIVVAASTLVVLVVMLIALVRHTMRLSAAVTEFAEAVRPVLEDIRRDAERAGRRLEETRSRPAARR